VQASIPWHGTLAGFRNLTIKLHGDRSWREVELILRTPDAAYRLDRPILLSSASWSDLILIRDSEGDIPWGTYRLLEAKGESGTGSGQARIEIKILRASHLTVVLRKLWQNYPSGLTFIPFARYLFNTLLICALVVIGVLISCSLVAYGLARIRWQGRNGLFYIIIATMMLPFQVTMVPLFVVFARLGWVDTFLPLFVPAFFGNAFFVFLLRQFFLTIPPELTDAARVDGCSEFGIYWRVVLPLAKPALATVGLFAFMNTWNDYVGPLIYLSDTSKYTLSLGLATFSSQYGSYPGMLMAVTAVMTIPIIILFFVTQRTFIQGITLTGLKG
jgi:multiple sugar transport system permease protein